MSGASSSNVERGAEILVKLGEVDKDGMTLAELAEALGDTKPAIHRALVGLGKHGFVLQTSRRSKYRLGPAIYGLAMKPFSTRAVVEMIRPVLIQTSLVTGGSSYLLSRGGFDVICLDFEEGQFIMPASVGGVGGRQPMGMGAASVCILAQLDEPSRNAILSANEPRIKEHITLDRVLSSIEFFLENGYAVHSPNVQRSTINVAVALPAEKTRMLAAISVILPDRESVDAPAVADAIKAAIAERLP